MAFNEILNKLYAASAYLEENRNKTQFDPKYKDIYGEVTLESTNAIVEEFKDHFNSETVFYDLGSGLGKMVIHIGLQYGPKKSCGIELSKERFDASVRLKSEYCKDLDSVEFIKSDYFKVDISDATVVYIDNTLLEDQMTLELIEILPSKCLFIMRRKVKYDGIQELDEERFKTTYNKTKLYYLIKD